MQSIDIYQRNGCFQIGACIFCFLLGIFFLTFGYKSAIIWLCSLFFIATAVSGLIGFINNKLPIVRIYPDCVMYRISWFRTYKTLPFDDIERFDFKRYIQTTFFIRSNDHLRVIAFLVNGKKKSFSIVNPVEDAETVASYLVGALNQFRTNNNY